MSKKQLINIANNTLQTITDGYYYLGKHQIKIAATIQSSVESSVLFKENELPSINNKTRTACNYQFTGEPTLVAAKRLSNKGDVCILNFASAKHPGGGFLKGTLAQEESIAYSSALYPALQKFDKDFYQYHINQKSPYYSNRIIYTPCVTVFRDNNYKFCSPYYVDVITSPAVNASVVLKNDNAANEKIKDVMTERIRRIIHIAAWSGNKKLILGAFGCGVFGNKIETVAGIFADILKKENMEKYFTDIVFAIYDRTDIPLQKFCLSFREKY